MTQSFPVRTLVEEKEERKSLWKVSPFRVEIDFGSCEAFSRPFFLTPAFSAFIPRHLDRRGDFLEGTVPLFWVGVSSFCIDDDWRPLHLQPQGGGPHLQGVQVRKGVQERVQWGPYHPVLVQGYTCPMSLSGQVHEIPRGCLWCPGPHENGNPSMASPSFFAAPSLVLFFSQDARRLGYFCACRLYVGECQCG